MSHPKVDPELSAQLDAHAADERSIGAVFTLEPDPERSLLPPDEVEAAVHRILRSVEQETGTAPAQVTVFKNMGAFAVEAGAPFVRGLLGRDEIATAMANRRSEDVAIRPVSSRRVDGPRPRSRKSGG